MSLAAVVPSTAAEADFAALLEKVHGIGRDIVAPAADEVDRDARFPREAFAALRAEKLLSAYVPQEYGRYLWPSDGTTMRNRSSHMPMSTPNDATTQPAIVRSRLIDRRMTFPSSTTYQLTTAM